MEMRHKLERLRVGDVAKIVVAVLIYAVVAAVFAHSLMGWIK